MGARPATMAALLSLVAAQHPAIDDAPRTPGPCDARCLARQPPVDAAGAMLMRTVEYAVTGSLYGDLLGRCPSTNGACEITRLRPYDARLRSGGDDWPYAGHTMVGHKRLRNVREALQAVVADGVPGDYAELGVWRGGSCIYAKAVLAALRQRERAVHVFDAFQSVPGYKCGVRGFLVNTEADVRATFARYGALDGRTHFHRGLFENALPAFRRAHARRGLRLAVLRIDANFYSSYQAALYHLWDFVPRGGIVIFDDVFLDAGVMRCWQDFRNDQRLEEELHRIDAYSGWFRKASARELDWSTYVPPPTNLTKWSAQKAAAECDDDARRGAARDRLRGAPRGLRELPP